MPSSSVRSPLDDLTYDLITVLQHKAKALEAYEKYLSDAVDDDDVLELLSQMQKEDEGHVRSLKEALARRLDEELDDEDADYDDDDVDEIEDTDDAVASDDGGNGNGNGNDRTAPPRRGESSRRRS